jgi:hypothetical protein
MAVQFSFSLCRFNTRVANYSRISYRKSKFVEDFMVATGGTITECGDCKIHTFTGPGTFTVSSLGTCATKNIVSHLVIAGGGSGQGADGGGGGGAGGYREVKNPVNPYTASPLDGYPSAPNSNSNSNSFSNYSWSWRFIFRT